MSFEKFLYNDIGVHGFGTKHYLKNFKERQNVSRGALDSGAGCIYLQTNSFHVDKYDAVAGPRYVGCLSLVYDLVLSVFDVSSGTLIIGRFVDFTVATGLRFERALKFLKIPVAEARIIGLQNGENFKVVHNIALFMKKCALPLVEVDLFGTDTRHLCFDIKTGTSFDVLINNKLYKPGELANTLTVEQFERGLSPTIQKPGEI